MPQVASIDYPGKRIYLAADTVTAGVNPVEVYKEVRARRALHESDRKFRPIISAQGNEPKGGGAFTPRRAVLTVGTSLVPHDVSHRLRILTEVITDDERSGADCFDRSLLSPGVTVDIDVAYQQTEILTVPVSGVLLGEQAAQIKDLHDTLEAPGVFSRAALANTSLPAAIQTGQRFDINLIARSEEGVNSPQAIQYREVVFCPDADNGTGVVFIGRRDGSPLPIVTEG